MIITLSGPNNFAARQTLNALTQKFVQKYGASGVERYSGEEFDLAHFADITQGATLFATNRLVIIRDASKNKTLWEKLGEVVGETPDETTIVLMEDAPDKRTRTYKQLKAKGELKEFAALSESELLKWLQTEAKALGGVLDAATARHLLSRAGTDQWRLFRELEKLIGYQPEVTTEAIDELVEPSAEANAFELLDAVLAKKTATMRQLLAKLETAEDPYKLFGLLVSQVHTLALVASAGVRTPDAIAKTAGLHPFVVRKMGAVAKAMSMTDLRRMVQTVADADYALKSTGTDPWLILEQTLAKIAAL